MRSAQSPLARLFLLLGLIAWVFGLFARVVHEAEGVHQICAEHGELVEATGADEASPKVMGAQISSDDRVENHEHGCTLQAVATAAAVPIPAVATPIPPPTSQTLNTQLAWVDPIRGPPLAYAPKTSPPLA